ncbi:MAG TPA: DUF1573 domain-containing protein [Planctomycetota bacterium]|nr:DUF1573 domain-containing protein [Planctomycetota bacterium]
MTVLPNILPARVRLGSHTSAPLSTSTLAALVAALSACGGGEAPAPAQQTAQAPAATAVQTPQPPRAQAPAQPAQPAQPAAHDEHDGHDHGPLGHAAADEPSAASSTFSSLPQNARLQVDVTDHDFGTAVEGEVLVHTYPMKSTGEGPLVISTAKPTCGCTVSKLEVQGGDGQWSMYEFGAEIAPGTEMRLTAELDTKNKKNLASSRINIFCNDPRSTVTLGLKAMLDTYFNVAPANIDFGEISVADSVERSFEVSGKQPGPFALALDERALPEGIKIDVQPVSPTPEGKAERWKVALTLGPDAREGNVGFPVSLMSDIEIAGAKPGVDGEVPRYGATVMTQGRVRGLIAWEPQYLSFGLVKPGQVTSRSFNMQSFDPNFEFGGDLTMRFVGPHDGQPDFKWADSFSAVARPAANGKGVDIEVTLNGLPEGADGAFQGRLVIETGHGSKPEVAVLFSGVCRNTVGTALPTAGG